MSTSKRSRTSSSFAHGRDAEARGLLQLPGLVAHYLVKGTKGVRCGAYAAVWIYESREAWEHLWGTPEHPRLPQDYPETWRVWEQELLAPFLRDQPDAISFTAYEELQMGVSRFIPSTLSLAPRRQDA